MKNRLLSSRPLDTECGILMLRLIFGLLFVYYGYQKLVSYDDIVLDFPDPVGIGSKWSFILVIFAELVGGIFVAFGFITRLSVIPILITMTVAFFIAHADDPFPMKQLSFIYMLLSMVVFVLGSGHFSIDKLVFRK